MIPRSNAEAVIREAVVLHLRQALPDARVIHELSANGCRIDVAAVTQDRLYFFEIKSERDKLERLSTQVKRFALCSHATFVVLHAKWFDRTPLPPKPISMIGCCLISIRVSMPVIRSHRACLVCCIINRSC